MVVRDLLELDDEQFERRIEAVKRRMSQPAAARLKPYVPDFTDTMPSAPMPLMPSHAASELHDEDKCRPGEGAGVVLWPVGIIFVVAVGAFIAWGIK